jgi:hypothetical protein
VNGIKQAKGFCNGAGEAVDGRESLCKRRSRQVLKAHEDARAISKAGLHLAEIGVALEVAG